jgi:hypothetical protein
MLEVSRVVGVERHRCLRVEHHRVAAAVCPAIDAHGERRTVVQRQRVFAGAQGDRARAFDGPRDVHRVVAIVATVSAVDVQRRVRTRCALSTNCLHCP